MVSSLEARRLHSSDSWLISCCLYTHTPNIYKDCYMYMYSLDALMEKTKRRGSEGGGEGERELGKEERERRRERGRGGEGEMERW